MSPGIPTWSAAGGLFVLGVGGIIAFAVEDARASLDLWEQPMFLIMVGLTILATGWLIFLAGRQSKPRLTEWWRLRHGGWSPTDPVGDDLFGRVVATDVATPSRVGQHPPQASRHYTPSETPIPLKEGRTVIHFTLEGPDLPNDVFCIVSHPEDPALMRKSDHLYPTSGMLDLTDLGHRSKVAMAAYPDRFPNALPAIPGIYQVMWVAKPFSGPSRVLLNYETNVDWPWHR